MKLMLANEAIARGAYEAGVKVLSAYPGTPSTEIAENVAKYSEIYAEWAPNEKVALEVAVGSSLAGVRSMACMKHVGLNVAADPLFTAAYTGVNAGLVIVVADDPSMHSSQNEQDSRYYAKSAHIPMLEPADSSEAKEFTKYAFELSEKYDTPVALRLATRIAHSQSLVELCDRAQPLDKPYVKDVSKNVMMPASAKLRHVAVERREDSLQNDCNSFDINYAEYNDLSLGIVTAGAVYQYVKEALPTASVFKIGLVYPLPIDAIKEFAEKVDRLIVIEELEPIIETELKANGIACEGKSIFSKQGELSVSRIRHDLLGKELPKASEVVARPPVMCAGCPHRGVFYALKRLGAIVNADIGCYTLGAVAPLSSVDSVLCMGASIGMAHGFDKALGSQSTKNVVAVIGDSTFIHSGITGLVNAVYNQSQLTLVILDNSTTGMTGHQQHPATGKTLKGTPTYALDIPTLVKAIGVGKLDIVDSYDLKLVEKTIKEAMAYEGVSVVIAKRACALLDKSPKTPMYITDKCIQCGACMKIGCPAVSKLDGKTVISKELCVGCGVCASLCPKSAIVKE